VFISVAEDIEHLRQWWKCDPDRATVRRGSAILRRFFVDRDRPLLRAWRECGFENQPIIKAPDLIGLLNDGNVDLSKVMVALAGGAKIKGAEIAFFCIIEHTGRPAPVLDLVGQTEDKNLREAKWRLNDFGESAAIVAQGEIVKRRELIKYYANKLGGVHLSSNVRRSEEKLVKRINKLGNIVTAIAEMDSMYFELLSIGQAVGKSEDLAKLCQEIRSREGNR
jgi:hypothetical protein